MLENMEYEPRYLEGIRHFNACEFYEAHEVWEELWADCRGPIREFYQGLIQVAVALHHFGNGNIRGAIKLYHSSRKHLQPYFPNHLGCDTRHLFIEMEEYRDDKNWAYFYTIKGFTNDSYQKMSTANMYLHKYS